MIADQNVKFNKIYFWSVVSFHPGAVLLNMGVNPNKLYVYGSWLEEHKSGFKFNVGYSMMKIWHLEVTYLF